MFDFASRVKKTEDWLHTVVFVGASKMSIVFNQMYFKLSYYQLTHFHEICTEQNFL